MAEPMTAEGRSLTKRPGMTTDLVCEVETAAYRKALDDVCANLYTLSTFEVPTGTYVQLDDAHDIIEELRRD